MIKLELHKYWKLLSLLVFIFVAVSCSEDEEIIVEDPPVEEPVETSKTFIYDHFKENYFWLDKLPELDPSTYSTDADLVNALRYKEVDRWSFVEDLDEYKKLFENAQTKGFGVGMAYFVENEGTVNEKIRLFVRFTYKNAPMGLAGVDRGWEIVKINDVAISDIENLGTAFDTDNAVKFTFVTTAGETVSHSMTRVDYPINTVLHTSVHEVAGKKVGYLVYESFVGDGSEGELKDAFQLFANESIDDIVVDLRYNGGGRLDIAWRLSELLGGSEVVGKVLTTFKLNSKRSDEEGSLPGRTGVNNAVNFDRLFFITTEGSASASEMVINAMFPYKDVILIGEKTHGKPVGMEVEESDDYNIALAAVTFQLVNAHGNGHYYDGIPVNHEEVDDIFHAWGDPEEACLKKALGIISGDDQIALKSSRLRPIPLPLERGLQEITGAY